MGHGLCAQFALVGMDVVLIDHRESNAERARERIERAIDFLGREGLADVEPAAVLKDVTFTTGLASGVAEADVVLETVSEDIGTKHAVFESAVENAPADAVLATNTSSLRVTDVAAGVPDEAHWVVGCHWWNPPYLLAPVEAVRGEETSAGTVARTAEFVE
ncbi:3-hydroxyacyl-CoA dehydrogenase, partial [Halobacteriales archaeon QH_8_64_26]